MAERRVRTKMDILLAESWAEGWAEGKAEGHRAALLDILSTVLTPRDLEICRQDLEGMTLEQMPDFGDTAKVIIASYRRLRTEVMQMCQPPPSPEPRKSGDAF